MPLDSSATVMSGGGVLTSVTSAGVSPAFSISASAYRWLMVPNEAAIFLPFKRRQVVLVDARALARDQRHGRVGAELGGAAAVVAERDQVHAAQHRADHRHAHLHDLALAGLQRIQRIDAGRIRPRHGHVEAVLLEEAALQRDRQADLVDAGDHAGLQLHQVSAPRRSTARWRSRPAPPAPAAAWPRCARVQTTSISSSRSPWVVYHSAGKGATRLTQ